MPMTGDLYPFTQKNVDNSPNTSGNYALYRDGTLIYYGMASGRFSTIRVRLQRHKRGDEGACTRRATHYRREIRQDAEARERQLLREYYAIYGRLPECNDQLPV